MDDSTKESKTVVLLVKELNRSSHERNWFVCYNCNRLVLGRGYNCPTSKRGEDEKFCENCCEKCETCGSPFAKGYEYEHRNVNECWK